jgi:hypothetical protein
MPKDEKNLQGTKKLIGALLRMPPKPHSEMKLGNPWAKSVQNPKPGRVKTRRKQKS